MFWREVKKELNHKNSASEKFMIFEINLIFWFFQMSNKLEDVKKEALDEKFDRIKIFTYRYLDNSIRNLENNIIDHWIFSLIEKSVADLTNSPQFCVKIVLILDFDILVTRAMNCDSDM